MTRPTDRDLFAEEQSMASMSFGEHLEELRARLILALLGLFVGVVITFIPPLNLGMRITRKMEDPAHQALERFYKKQAKTRAEIAEQEKAQTQPVAVIIPAGAFAQQLHEIAPELPTLAPGDLQGKSLTVPMRFTESELIPIISDNVEHGKGVVTLAPLEGITIYFTVCLVAGLVIASPWVFYQLWAFVAAGLYRHEQAYVKRFLPFSLGLFLSGVFLCFFVILPFTLSFLLEFNVWLGIDPTLRLSEWMGFATILPLVFGICFQTPLVMLFLERIGIFTINDYRSKRRIAILIMVVAAAIITPTPDPMTMMLLAAPMVILYELGIFLVARRHAPAPAKVAG